jgi:hypothetical protein
MKLPICLCLFLLCAGCRNPAEPVRSSANAAKTPSPVKSPARVFEEEARAGYLYWATPTPILAREWRLVLGGTVVETHPDTAHYGDHKKTFAAGTLRVEKIFLNLPTENYIVSPNVKRFKSDLFDGLKPGDKVIVFAVEYDGGYGLIEVPDSNCKIGIKVDRWSDSIVGAVERMIERTPEGDWKSIAEMLGDPAYAEIWRPYSPRGIDHLLEQKDYYR